MIISAALIALGTSVATPRIEALCANAIHEEDRSVANAIMAVVVLALSTPFGYIGGVLSGIGAELPFVLILAIFFVCMILLRAASAIEKKTEAIKEEA